MQNQLNFKGSGNRLYILAGGAVKFHCKEDRIEARKEDYDHFADTAGALNMLVHASNG